MPLLLATEAATTVGAQALSISNEHEPTSRTSSHSREETVRGDPSGRKRRKISHLETVPLAYSTPNESAHSEGPPVSTGQFDHLLHWQERKEARDYELEDDLNHEEERVEEVSEEDEMSEADGEGLGIVHRDDGPRRAGTLSEGEIVAIINEKIEEYTSAWRPGKGEDAIPDPEILWQEAEDSGRRVRLLAANQVNAQFFKDRLSRLGDEILRSPWGNAAHVRHICKTMETTVNLVQEAEWLVSIYSVPPEGETGGGPVDGPDAPAEQDLAARHRDPTVVIDLGSSSESSEGGSVADQNNVTIANDLQPSTSTEVVPAISQAVQTPRPQLASPTPTHVSSAIHKRATESVHAGGDVALHGSRPEAASIKSVAQWKWEELVDKRDRKRIIMKLIHDMESDSRETLRTRILSVRKQNLLTEIPACVRTLVRQESRMPDLLPRHQSKTLLFTKMFLSWWLADDYISKPASESRLEELAGQLKAGCADLNIFYDWLSYILANTFSEEALTKPHAPSQAEIIVISDDEDG